MFLVAENFSISKPNVRGCVYLARSYCLVLLTWTQAEKTDVSKRNFRFGLWIWWLEVLYGQRRLRKSYVYHPILLIRNREGFNTVRHNQFVAFFIYHASGEVVGISIFTYFGMRSLLMHCFLKKMLAFQLNIFLLLFFLHWWLLLAWLESTKFTFAIPLC